MELLYFGTKGGCGFPIWDKKCYFIALLFKIAV
ncbi:hypothetical protein Nmel_008498 [Mimus melanotis]